MDSQLYTSNVDFHNDLVRNIPGIRKSQHLFDDLSADAADWAVAIAAEGKERIPTSTAIVTRPFDYGSVISYSFETSHWQTTRYSDGTRYAVWYGALDVETTVRETAHHWRRFLLDSFAEVERDIVSDRRVCEVRCDALLLDLRAKHLEFPALVQRDSYAYTQQVGRYVHEQGMNGLLVQSARGEGVTAAIFRAERLSNVREKMFLTYRINLARDSFVAQKTRGRNFLAFAPSTLA